MVAAAVFGNIRRALGPAPIILTKYPRHGNDKNTPVKVKRDITACDFSILSRVFFLFSIRITWA